MENPENFLTLIEFPMSVKFLDFCETVFRILGEVKTTSSVAAVISDTDELFRLLGGVGKQEPSEGSNTDI